MLLVLASSILSCNSDTQNKAEAVPAPAGNTPHFVFANGPKALEYKAEGSWCDARFPEAPPITGDPVNANLRRIGFGTGIYKVNVNFGTIVSSFILRNKSNGAIELYSSNHFPYCLSDHKNFSLAPNGLSFSYDNHHHIKYTVELQQTQQAYFLAITYDPGGNYGFSVHKCANCIE